MSDLLWVGQISSQWRMRERKVVVVKWMGDGVGRIRDAEFGVDVITINM